MIDVSYSVPKMSIPDLFTWQGGEIPPIPEGSVIFPLKVTGEIWGGTEGAGYNLQYELVIAPLGYAIPTLSISYVASREFAQIISFTLETDQQSIVTLAGEDESLLISINANKVTDPTYDGSIPFNRKGRNFTHSARGLQAIEHLLLVARANLIARSRAVEITFKTDWKEALRALSLIKAVLLHDPRLPGGQAVGKIVRVALGLGGDSGLPVGSITIACCVGKGGSYSTSPGTPSYVDDGYMDNVQEYTNQIVVTDSGDVQWTIPDPATFDDGLDFASGLTPDNAVIAMSIINPAATQKPLIEAAREGDYADQAKVSSVLQTIPTQISVQMKPMEGGPFQQEVVLTLSDLIVPKQIDLEAPSNA
jgi:hypothetical protein